MNCENCGFKHQCGVGWALSNGAAGSVGSRRPSSLAGYIGEAKKSNDPWDNLKVEDVVKTTLGTLSVQAVIGKIVALKAEGKSTIYWENIKSLEERGYTIKDSTPKEENEDDALQTPCPRCDERWIIHDCPKKTKTLGEAISDLAIDSAKAARTKELEWSHKDFYGVNRFICPNCTSKDIAVWFNYCTFCGFDVRDYQKRP